MERTPILDAGPENLARAARLLRAGRLVGLPTETVYGLAGDATNRGAVRAIYRVKKRPPDNPLIVHVAGIEAARELAALDDRAERLIEALWPGPLTLVLRRAPSCPAVAEVSAGLATVAVRMPDHGIALAVLAAVGRPVAAPSANPAAAVSPTTARHVADHLGGIAAILDGGPCRIGLESTVVGLHGRRAALLRPGGVPRAAIERLIGPLTAPASGDAEGPQRSPGRLGRHYAPSRPLRLDAAEVAADEALLAFGGGAPAGAALCRNLSAAGDLDEAARNLFAMLRELDRPDVAAIAVMPIPEAGLGAAINDRLRRAATASG